MIVCEALYNLGLNGNINLTTSISYFLNLLYTLCSCLICFFYFSLCFKIKPIFTKKNTNIIKFIDILIVLIILVVTTIYYENHLFFYINDTMEYCRGIYYNHFIFIIFLPVIVYLFINIYLYHKSNDFIEKTYIKSLILFSIPPLIGEIISIYLPYTYILLCSITISIILLYITIQDICVTNDLLTGINNRGSLEKYFFNERSRKLEHQYLFLMDINKFKSINDNYGHIMGDKALVMFSNFLKNVVSEKGTIICRYGGDEFIIITKCSDNNEAEYIKNYLNDKLVLENKKHNYKFEVKTSIGYSKYKKGYSLKKWINKADKAMYKDKKSRN